MAKKTDTTMQQRLDEQRALNGAQPSMPLPDPAMLAQLAGQNPMNAGMLQSTMPASMPMPMAQEPAGLGGLVDEGATDGLEDGRTSAEYGIQGSVITKEMLKKATDTMQRYKRGKASVERRIISAQEWWKLRNWEQIEAEKNIKGSHSSKSNTAWLWNCIVGKHADAMDAYPEPAILPRMPDDEDQAKLLSDIVPVVLKLRMASSGTRTSCTGWETSASARSIC